MLKAVEVYNMNDLDRRPSSEEKSFDPEKRAVNRRVSIVSGGGDVVNASGHKDQLQRQYGLLAICGLALTIDNAWVALGGSIAVSICKTPQMRQALNRLPYNR